MLGVAAFWTPVIWYIVRPKRDLEHTIPMVFGLLASVLIHAVGIGLALATPSTRRLLPALANVVPLAIIAALVILGRALE